MVNSQQWMSVIVFGRYEELPDTPEWKGARTFAYELLKQNAIWWEPAYVKTILHGTDRPLVPVFYRIDVKEITGHRALQNKERTSRDTAKRPRKARIITFTRGVL